MPLWQMMFGKVQGKEQIAQEVRGRSWRPLNASRRVLRRPRKMSRFGAEEKHTRAVCEEDCSRALYGKERGKAFLGRG